MTTTQQQEETGEEEQKPSVSQAAANNNHNSQRFLDGIVNHRAAESAVFCWSKAAPEVLGVAGRFPLGPGIIWPAGSPMNHAQGGGSRGICKPYFQPRQSGKFPIYLNLTPNQGFPLCQWEVANSYQLKSENILISSETEFLTAHKVYAQCTASFPLQQVYAPWNLNFPELLQLPRKNSDGAFPEISITMTRRRGQVATSSPAEQAPQEFPIIKKRFVSFPNYRAMPQDGPQPQPHPNPPTAATTTTMTQPDLAKVTEIDEISGAGGGGGGGGTAVHKVPPMFDNELEAEEQATTSEEALNLNVAREIEHQQAENLNDAFGERRHDHSRKNDDAITITMGEAKNKREICEQSKLEKAEDHNEPNMRDLGEQQSICLAREQTIDGHQHQIGNGDRQRQRHRNSNHQQSGDLSDVRESSPEQLDGNLGRQLTRERNPNPNSNPNPNPCPNRTLPNIELLKSSVRVFLAERNWDWDWELLDLLTDAIELICGQPKEQEQQQQETGNLWSESPVAGADMTVSKVSEERDTETTVDVYPAEQLDHQPAEQADDNNTSTIESPSPSDMKYELKTASAALPSRRSPPRESPVSRLTATSRIRNVEPSAPPLTHAPLLGDLKRSSISRDSISSIDADSVLPERTRLRRQRRIRSQDSVEKPEDVIERLNKLKARISGALSEVKGVLKQYSTESEAEAAGEQSQVKPGGEDEAAPVSFRFVKKVRRRSYFDEAEEEKEQAGEANLETKVETTGKEVQGMESLKTAKDSKIQREQTPFARDLSEVPEKHEDHFNKNKELSGKEEKRDNEKLETTEVRSHKIEDTKNQGETILESQDGQSPKDQDNLDGEAIKIKAQQENIRDHTNKSHIKESVDPQILDVKQEPPKMNGELSKTADKINQPEKSKTQAKIEFLAKVQSELKSKTSKEATTKEETYKEETSTKDAPHKEVTSKEAATKEITSKETTLKEASPKKLTHKEKVSKESASKELSPKEPTEESTKKDLSPIKSSESEMPDDSPASQPPPKIKKKVIVKVKNPRRASIAAVEPSKIKVEPAVEQIDALITQRRPSDSEAIVKRKKKLKLMGDTAATATATSLTTSPRATSSGATKDTIAEETTALAVATAPEVTAVPAKLPSAKSDQGEATAEATSATPPIDGDPPEIGNLAPAGDRNRRASLKLAELVGETVLVVPAASAAGGPKDPESKCEPESKEPIDQQERQLQQVAIAADIAPQIAPTLRHEESSAEPSEQAATKAGEQAPPGDSLATMPELKVLAGPVQPVKIETVEQPHDEGKNQEPLVKKKAVHLKKLVRKNSLDKDPVKQEQKQLSNILRDRNKINELSSRINKLTPPKKQVKPKEEEKKAPVVVIAGEDKPKPEEAALSEEVPAENEEVLQPEPEVEPAPVPKKPRKVKKKVIIKRQKRRLSVGDTFFLQPEPEEPAIPEVETIERAIAYVTDDEEDTKAEAPQEEEQESVKPLKSCLHVREYKIGDLVLYAERYRKTQVRWKRGRVLERITSISYKLEIEGKEVPAHVSYIKKYTGRKVRFGNKEYLEIDYEQVAEEERRAASYSIWNMV
ncbi:titin [Drosophila biarmipes]|uniref:titin n=1 Tax=Drosophila biarmipes TaxID=125945 RepID=UPI0007E65417|nr:titin [Drosophila biarmipes]